MQADGSENRVREFLGTCTNLPKCAWLERKDFKIMREKFARFMQGRYGVDEFARFTMGAAVVLIVLSIFFGGQGLGSILDFVGLLAIIYTYYRIFSRNIQKRYEENQKYLHATANIRSRFQREKNLMAQRKTHHIYTCPGCGQKIRIPRGSGRKVEIDCPKCHTKFIKKI
jgi:DNA-directed RNA polymerase subunit RPC12/RpoP